MASLDVNDGPRALEVAVRLNDAQRVREVLATFPSLARALDDAMPNGDFGATPLIAAAAQCNREMIDVLLDAGANINQRTHWWAGSFGVMGDDPVLNQHLISRGAMVDAHDAARLGWLDRLKEMVAADKSVVNAGFGDGQTPLHVAASPEIAELLLDNGADIDALDVDHESTPAQYLVRDRQDVVRLLVSRGCTTDILTASAIGDVDLVRRHLIADPRSVWTTVSSRYFPMRDARAGGTIYIWTLGGGKSAHAIAREFKHDDIFALLMDETPDVLQLALACDAGDEVESARLVARNPAIVANLDADLLERLPGAAQQNNTQAVRLMLAAGWPASAHNDQGVTALHWAAFHGNREMTIELLRNGAAVDAKDKTFDGTPRGWGEYGAGNGRHGETANHAAVIEALSEAGGV